jgi:hypothetical protein
VFGLLWVNSSEVRGIACFDLAVLSKKVESGVMVTVKPALLWCVPSPNRCSAYVRGLGPGLCTDSTCSWALRQSLRGGWVLVLIGRRLPPAA